MFYLASVYLTLFRHATPLLLYQEKYFNINIEFVPGMKTGCLNPVEDFLSQYFQTDSPWTRQL